MTHLARKLRLVDYFALGFGVMVGTAWLVVMDDILRRGGPLGAILGFTLGALILFPIGYVYGQLIKAIPDAAGEAAYVGRFFPPAVSFATGWMMLLSYSLTCPFEALAAGRITGYLLPSLNTHELYRVGGYPVYLPHIALGLGLTVVLTWLNYRGIQASARLSKAATFTFLTLVVLFALAGARHGSTSNFFPLFSHSPLLSILLVWQVVPWLVSGFESVGKCAEEASPGFAERNFSVATLLTILSGMIFFWVVIGAVSFVAPWQSLDRSLQFPTAVAFERALHAHWIVVLIMGSALVALVQAFNANIIASSRLLYAMSRHNLLNPVMSGVHPRNRTPVTAILTIGLATAATIFMGEALLVPILEVGAVSAAVGWMAACASYCRMQPGGWGRAAAVWGLFVTSAMILVKLLPWVPGHFTWHEWVALGIWAALGLAARASRERNYQEQIDLETADAAN
ncbi:MAG TPA: APC family permease [Candidatus Sulfotelmatobacter sp.]|jgi:amino acid transporter|nr:APC family permease [Candidatus Sulfotelmatobacter sp.]